MRTKLPETVERGRVAFGSLRTDHGNRYGAFVLKHPPTGQFVKVVFAGGDTWAADGMPGEPWEHASVSLMEFPHMTPSWEVMQWVKELFWEDTEWCVQYHPARSEYVNEHPGVLHIWKPPGGLPTPPRECV